MKSPLACNFLDIHSARRASQSHKGCSISLQHHQCNESQGISGNIRNLCNNYDMLEFTLIARRWSHGPWLCRGCRGWWLLKGEGTTRSSSWVASLAHPPPRNVFSCFAIVTSFPSLFIPWMANPSSKCGWYRSITSDLPSISFFGVPATWA